MKAVEIITSKVIESLEKGTIPWQKPWLNPNSLQRNPFTKRVYQGSNQFFLSIMGMPSNQWGTLNHWTSLGERVRIEEARKGTPIVHFGDGQKKNKSTGEIEGSYKYLRFFNVYNESQLESWNGTSKYDDQPKASKEPVGSIESVEQWIASNPMSMLKVEHGGTKACYSPQLDSIRMPERNSFNSVNAYYATLFHELGHATGHESRLNRKGIVNFDRFGSHQYSQEELVAEIYSNAQLSLLGINDDSLTTNTIAYCQNWLKVLKSNPDFLIKASKESMKAIEYMNPNIMRVE